MRSRTVYAVRASVWADRLPEQQHSPDACLPCLACCVGVPCCSTHGTSALGRICTSFPSPGSISARSVHTAASRKSPASVQHHLPPPNLLHTQITHTHEHHKPPADSLPRATPTLQSPTDHRRPSAAVSDSFRSSAWGAPAAAATNGACTVMDGSMGDGEQPVVRWVGVLGWWCGPRGCREKKI